MIIDDVVADVVVDDVVVAVYFSLCDV